MRILLFISLLWLAGCSLPAPLSTENQASESDTTEVEHTLGENEAMPENIESLETEDVPADETGLMPIAIGDQGTIVFGNPDAPRLSLFTDYTCTYCSQVSRQYVPWILEKYVENGSLSLEFVFLPIAESGVLPAKVALCAATQELFSPADKALHETLMSSTKELPALAKKIGADAKDLTECVNDPEVNAILGLHRGIAEDMGIQRVPGFALNGQTWLGVGTTEELMQNIESAL